MGTSNRFIARNGIDANNNGIINPGNYPKIKPSLLLDFANSEQVDPRITFTRATTATRTNKHGLIETVAANVPRIDYDPNTGECKGLLIEEQRTNLLTYSEQFDNAAWNKTNASITANMIVAPDGTLTADRLIENTENGTHSIYQLKHFTYTTLTFSLFVKANGRNRFILDMSNAFNYGCGALFDLLTGNIISVSEDNLDFSNISAGITKYNNGWYRCTLTATKGSVNSNVAVELYINNGATTVYTGDETSGFYIWGAQLEVGAFPTSYIPTVDTTITRNADAASMTWTNFSSWYRQDEGSIFADISYDVPPGVPILTIPSSLISASDGNHIIFTRLVAYNQTYYSDAHNEPNNFDFNGATIAPNVSVKTALGIKDNNTAFSINGSIEVDDNCSSGKAMTHLWLSNSVGVKHIRSMAYYPKRLSNSELQALTL